MHVTDGEDHYDRSGNEHHWDRTSTAHHYGTGTGTDPSHPSP